MGKFELLFHLNVGIINVIGFVVGAMRTPKYLAFRSILKRNHEMKKYKNNDICFICGNGPSLKAVDFSKLKGDLMVVNDFYRMGPSVDISPTYYCIVDGDYGTDKMENLKEAVKSFPNTAFFLNSQFRKNICAWFPNKDNFYYTCSWKGFLKHVADVNQTRVTGIPLNVVCAGIALAQFLEYKEIVLLGCDFNSFALPHAAHCYDESSDRSRKITLSFELFCYSFVADIHSRLNRSAKKKGITIVNATPNSLIDAYERNENYFGMDSILKED